MDKRWGTTALLGVVSAVVVAVGATPSAARPADAPPGAPGKDPGYASADKQGFGTSRTRASHVWFTLGHGGTTELYYPNLSTPASRRLQVIVTDGETFAQRLSDVPTRTTVPDPQVPSYRQVSTGRDWTATATYVTDPQRPSVLTDLQVRSLTGEPLEAYVVHEPTLGRDGSDDTARTVGHTLVASDGSAASSVSASPAFTGTSSGYLGTSDGWTDLAAHHGLTAHHHRAGPGNVGQVGRLPLDGVHRTHAVVTVGYGPGAAAATESARKSAGSGFDRVSGKYQKGWKSYADSLDHAPDSLTTPHETEVYESSLTMLAASEDKQNPGAFVASPSMPWAWRNDPDLAPVPGPYHLVWPRDLYQHATALLAAGDTAAANRAWEYLMSVQRPDGHMPQNTETTGEPHWTSIQLDETALPIVLAWQLGRTDAASLDAVRKAAHFLISFQMEGHRSPWSQQERWENQDGYSPGTIASAIAGLVCAADLVERGGDADTARHYRAVADQWAKKVDGWTATSTGPFSERPYYLRLSKTGNPDAGTMYDPGDNNPSEVDERTQVDPSFLELVRLGIKPADDPTVTNSLDVVDRKLAEDTSAGRFWHRFTNDGYGEEADGSDWNLGEGRTYGRLWPIFAGERGEYELLTGKPELASQRLHAMAATASDGLLLAEQVWDNRAPAGPGGPTPGTPTRSATPLAWTHAQYVRLALSIDAGHPVERPDVVVDRYAGR